ncbi:MAG: tetratricopeptide repeat protein [Phycisphaerales bacterium]|nr:tetratricopeptide repeat protein [Phycisphaerales bacterium]
MSLRCTWAKLALLIAVAAATRADEPRYLATRDVRIDYAMAAGSGPCEVELWVSRDGGQNWEPVQARSPATGTLRFAAPQDGRYDFFLVLTGEAGASGPAPRRGTPPTLSIVVDTLPPILQVHRVAPHREGAGLVLAIDATLIEEHASAAGLRVFYRTDAASDWIDGGPAGNAAGQLRWSVPATLTAPSCDLHLVATDRAGNRASDRVLAVPLRPADGDRVELAAADIDPADARATTTQPATAQPLATPAQEAASPEERALARQLRSLGEALLARGQTALALARLERAALLAPEDPELLLPLGRALLAAGRSADACRRFEARLAARPDESEALDGLADAALAARRYEVARAALHALLKAQPNAPRHWLRLGDAEYRRGETHAALDAWQRVATLSAATTDDRAAAQRRIEATRRATAPP